MLLDEGISSNNIRCFPIRIPDLPEGRKIDQAWIEIPPGFPDRDLIRISLPKKYILKVPHVESTGRLCIDGDPGPLSGGSATERIAQIIDLFYSSFIEPWSTGELDDHFSKEAMNYWAIHCSRHMSIDVPIKRIYTTNQRHNVPKIFKSTFIESKRIVVAGDDSFIKSRYVTSLSNGNTLSSVMVAEIPISFPFVPDTWPKNLGDIQRLVSVRLGPIDSDKFFKSVKRKNKSIHKIVIFKALGCAFGYLLPGGPPSKTRRGSSLKSCPSNRLIPLVVERLDVSWTTGRDQHQEYVDRQLKHVLIIGLGALGSPVSEQLAKSGVGKLTLVDDDTLSSANIGRHTLGANSIGLPKVRQLTESISARWPSCDVQGFAMPLQRWLKDHSLRYVDIILDLTGEPDVQLRIDQERKEKNIDLLISWMEPFVAAAHACLLPAGEVWILENVDRIESLNCIDWPDEVMINEPACSGSFQSYTSAAATYAVSLTTEAALDLIDKKIEGAIVRHWIRGQKYLDRCYTGLQFKEFAKKASSFDGLLIEDKL